MKRKHSFWLIFFLVIIFGVLSFIYFSSNFPEVKTGIKNISIVHSVLLLMFLCAIVILNRRIFKPNLLICSALFWAVLGLVLFSAYTYRFELRQFGSRLSIELNPSKAVIESSGSVSIRSNKSGHFVIEAFVTQAGQAHPVQFLIDTGASDVILSPAVASRLGFGIESLNFNKPYQTANGIVLAAPVRISRIQIGKVFVNDVRASVNGIETGNSLLGMSFLERLSSVEFKQDILTLKP